MSSDFYDDSDVWNAITNVKDQIARVERDNIKRIEEQQQLIDYQTTQITRLEQLIETNEMITAQLVTGYAEIASKLEALLTVFAQTDPEQRQELQREIAASHLRMLETFKKASENE